MMLVVTLRVADGARLHHRLHGRRPRLQALLQLHLAVHLLDADAGDGNNFLQLFFGWEAVGLVSYLLIGFWYTRPTAIYANLKAFLVNRVGDFGFLLGIGLVLAYFGTLDYAPVFAQGAASSPATTIDLWRQRAVVADDA